MVNPAAPWASPFKISVIIPVHNGQAVLAQCLQALAATTYPNYETIVVDDGSSDGSPAVAKAAGVKTLTLPERRGPAHARNRGAERATGDILFFIDADICVYPNTLGLMAQTFHDHPDDDAVFGSYDDSPGAPNFISQYKNLFHHFIHQTARPSASTFWSGCGAIKRAVFEQMGGFDETYSRSSIEDIELGQRLRAAQHAILLNKAIQVKHMKRWTLSEVIRSDIFDRGIPWTRLMLRHQKIPDDLNLRISQRVSVALAYGLLAGLVAQPVWAPLGWASGLALGSLVWINRPFYRFFAQKRGWLFALRVLPLHVLYFLYSGFAFACGIIIHWIKGKP